MLAKVYVLTIIFEETMRQLSLTLAFICFGINGFSQICFDKGIGVVYSRQNLKTLNQPQGDTICIYVNKNTDSLLCKYIYNPNDVFENSIIGANIVFKDRNILEYDNEMFGIPVNSLKGNWAEVIVGRTKQDTIRGWVNITNPNVGIKQWTYYLPTKSLFFEEKIQFFDTYEGKEIYVTLPVENTQPDYCFKILSRKRGWAKVLLLYPSNFCEQHKKVSRKKCWVRYLNNSGRPLVWFYPGGC